MQNSRIVLAAVAMAVLATACAKKEEAAPAAEAAAAAEAAPAAAAAPAEAAAAPAEAAAPAKDDDASQSGGDKVRP